MLSALMEILVQFICDAFLIAFGNKTNFRVTKQTCGFILKNKRIKK